MQPGLSSYTYTWSVGVPGSMPEKPASVYDLVDKANSLGITLLQVADNMPLEKLANAEVVDILNYANESKVALEFGSRGLTAEHTIECLDTANLLRSPILRMVIDSKDFEPDKVTIISIIRELLPEFKSRNIRLAIENHDRLKAREFEDIIQAVGSDLVGICLDSVNSMGAGEGFETVSDILLPYTINLHVKDFVIHRVSHKMGFVIEGRPAGKGMLNIRKITERLSELKRCNSAILELWTPPEGGIEETVIKEDKWAEESIRYLKTIIR